MRLSVSKGFFLASALAFAGAVTVPYLSTESTVNNEELRVSIVYPKEGAVLPFLKSSFIVGSVTPGASLVISSATAVSIHPNGGFLALIDLSPGVNDVVCEAATPYKKVSAMRRITVAEPLKSLPDKPLKFDKANHWPDVPVEYGPGDLLRVTCKGTPGVKARFRIKGLTDFLPMVEKTIPQPTGTPVAGIYEGVYRVQPGTRIKDGKIVFRLDRSGRHEEMTASGRFTVNPPQIPRVAEVTADLVAARTGPDMGSEQAGYELFWQKGVRLTLAGRVGNTLRVNLGDRDWAWIGEDQIALLPNGTPPPRSSVGSVATSRGERSTLVTMRLQERLPYRIDQSVDESLLTVTLYGGVSNTDWMHYDPEDPIVQSMAWQQPTPGVYVLNIRLKNKQVWGYDVRYEGNAFVLELRDPPHLAHLSQSKRPLQGLKICVDAGHGGEDQGAIGPLGTKEKDINLSLAKRLKDRLEAAGAEVFLTRDDDRKIPLLDRPRIAWQYKADLLISMHGNALPDGENPLEKNGYGMYYFQPRGLELAKQIHKGYQTSVRLRDDGVHYGNLALCRPTQMPAVLVESAYVIVPLEEYLLNDPNFQNRCVAAVTDGVTAYMRSIR